MNLQTRLKLMGAMKEGGLSFSAWDSIVGAGESGSKLNDARVSVEEETINGEKVYRYRGKDKAKRDFEVFLTPGIRKTLDVYRELQQGIIEGGGTGAIPETGQSTASNPGDQFDFGGSIDDALGF